MYCRIQSGWLWRTHGLSFPGRAKNQMSGGAVGSWGSEKPAGFVFQWKIFASLLYNDINRDPVILPRDLCIVFAHKGGQRGVWRMSCLLRILHGGADVGHTSCECPLEKSRWMKWNSPLCFQELFYFLSYVWRDTTTSLIKTSLVQKAALLLGLTGDKYQHVVGHRWGSGNVMCMEMWNIVVLILLCPPILFICVTLMFYG